MSQLLLDERPVVVQPSLVRRLGLVDAAIVQQLHYWLERATCVHDGEKWVYKTYPQWSDEIGVTAKQARGALDRLRNAGIVIAIHNPTNPHDRTLWWRIDYAALGAGPSAPGGSSPAPAGTSPAAGGSSNARATGGSSETTSQSTSETGARAPAGQDEFPEDLPEEMHETAIAVGKVLKRTAITRGQKREVTRAAVGHAILSFPDRPHLQVAREVEYWLLHGKGARKSCSDIVARYRNFLTNSEPAAGPPLPEGVAPLHGRRMANHDAVDARFMEIWGQQ